MKKINVIYALFFGLVLWATWATFAPREVNFSLGGEEVRFIERFNTETLKREYHHGDIRITEDDFLNISSDGESVSTYVWNENRFEYQFSGNLSGPIYRISNSSLVEIGFVKWVQDSVKEGCSLQNPIELEILYSGSCVIGHIDFFFNK